MYKYNQLPINLIYNFIYRLSGNFEAARNLTGQVFLTAYESIDNCNELFVKTGLEVFRGIRWMPKLQGK